MTVNQQKQLSGQPTCIAMRGNKVCGDPVASDGAGVLCDQHLLLHLNGSSSRFWSKRSNADQATLDLLKHQKDKQQKHKKEATPFYLKPPTVLLAIFAVSLFFIERIQSTILEVPSSLTIAGFDMTAAAIQNAGLGILVLVFAIITLAVVIALSFGVYLLGILSVFSSPAIVVLSFSQFFTFLTWLFRPRLAEAALRVELEQNNREKHALARWAERIWPSMRDKRDASLKAYKVFYARARKEYAKAKDRTNRKIKWIWNGLIIGENGYTHVIKGRVVSILVLFATAMVFAAEHAHDRNGRIDDIAQEEIAKHTPDAKVTKVFHPYFNPVSNFVYENLVKRLVGQKLLRFVSSEPQLGKMTFARQPTARSTLLDVSRARSGEDGFRTKNLIHIGEFGEWAFIARLEPTSERILVRRTAILEFSRVSNAKLEAGIDAKQPKAPISLGNGNRLDLEVNFTSQGRRPRITTTEVEGLEGVLVRITSDIARTQSMMARLADPVLRRREPQTNFTPLLERLVEVQEALEIDTRRLHEGQDWLSGTLLGVSSRLDGLSAVYWKLSEIFDKGPNNGNSDSWPRFDDMIRDGVPTRASGIINDLSRRDKKSYLTSCAKNQSMHLGFVDFKEFEPQKPEHIHEIQKIYEMLEKFRVEPSIQNRERLVFLRGGASYTGAPEANIRISESRAESVKHRLLLKLTGKTSGEPTKLEQEVLRTHRLTLVAFGVGERLHHSKNSSRAVEIFRCDTDGNQRVTQNTDLHSQ